ncbi:LINC00094 isoform 2 [Aix galericulata]|nr:LINC00094 isoform 2 [Aix galericulata]
MTDKVMNGRVPLPEKALSEGYARLRYRDTSLLIWQQQQQKLESAPPNTYLSRSRSMWYSQYGNEAILVRDKNKLDVSRDTGQSKFCAIISTYLYQVHFSQVTDIYRNILEMALKSFKKKLRTNLRVQLGVCTLASASGDGSVLQSRVLRLCMVVMLAKLDINLPSKHLASGQKEPVLCNQRAMTPCKRGGYSNLAHKCPDGTLQLCAPKVRSAVLLVSHIVNSTQRFAFCVIRVAEIHPDTMVSSYQTQAGKRLRPGKEQQVCFANCTTPQPTIY